MPMRSLWAPMALPFHMHAWRTARNLCHPASNNTNFMPCTAAEKVATAGTCAAKCMLHWCLAWCFIPPSPGQVTPPPQQPPAKATPDPVPPGTSPTDTPKATYPPTPPLQTERQRNGAGEDVESCPKM
eukprot:1159796-Pelagomonas_calceolata.AAC.4